ncbi:hypothetical protein NLJ89_g3071 [Agrocybe chaxingu]|uniref:Uncharacterized protein n=1 Tax=Agrocybe chaxingu TaxID=84603 RepID=A0A9W8K4P9_9AGAR|nr:hypothetical protein NLJ89_g3071 [Agrocybe chaxingu]
MIPQEILDAIIDELGHDLDNGDSHRALLACSLVNRAINHRCRKYLFSTIAAPTEPPANVHRPRVLLLVEILVRNPRLTDYVRHLDILQRVTRKAVQEDFTQHFPTVVNILLREGCRLETLRILHVHSSSSPISAMYSNMILTVQHAIFDILRGSTIGTIKLSNLTSVPPSILFQSPHLKHLELNEIIFLPLSEPDGPPGPETVLKLETLIVHRFLSNFSSLFTATMQGGLKYLDCRIAGLSDAKGFEDILAHSRSSIEELRFSTASTAISLSRCFSSALNLDHYPSLRKLSIDLALIDHPRHTAREDSLLLIRPSKPALLQSLAISVEPLISPNQDIERLKGWGELDDFLSDRNLPWLREVTVSLALLVQSHLDLTDEEIKHSRNRAEDGLQILLPRSSTRDGFKVTKVVQIKRSQY